MKKNYVQLQSAEKLSTLYVKLLQILTDEKLYLDPDVTSAMMAKRLECTAARISAAVSLCTGKNYSYMVNNLRLREVCRRLSSVRFAEMTIEDIGLSCGYRSRQSFYNAFQRHFGMTPLAWRNEHLEKKQKEQGE